MNGVCFVIFKSKIEEYWSILVNFLKDKIPNNEHLNKDDYLSITHQWAVVFGLQLLLEMIFLLASGLGFDAKTLLRILLFSLSSSAIVVSIAYLLKLKKNTWFISIYLLVMIVFALSQLGYKNYMGSYFSLKTVVSKIGDVGDYAFDFILYLKPQYFLVIIPILVYVWLVKKKLPVYKTAFERNKLIVFVSGAIFFQIFALFSLSWWPQSTSAYTLQELYYRPTQLDSALRQFGVSRFMMRDLLYTLSGGDDLIVLEPEEPSDPGNTPVDFTRVIDDTAWRSLFENESNETIKTIDEYLLSRNITPKNEMTGIFKDKNVIYIMVEALDYIAMDERVAPTLMKLMNEGMFFENYYAPTSACSTGDSELMAITSLLSIPGSCTHDSYYTNDFSSSLFELFKNDSYYASSYHNYTDWYYMRNEMHRNMGSEAYFDFNSLEMSPWYPWPDWPSDVDLIELSMDHFIDKEKFFSFMITVTMHNPYDRPTNYGDKYYEEIEAMYPEDSEYVIRYKSKLKETDKALEVMMDELENQGILDDTVIVLFADHHLLRTPFEIIDEYSKNMNRLEAYNLHRSPMVIYNSEIEPQVVSTYASTKDLVPTMANLFDLSYDPRVYMGVDIFSEESDHFVLFQDGGWVIEQGYYDPIRQEFVPNGSDMIDDESILHYNQMSRNLYQLSEAMFESNYYFHRSFIKKNTVDPDILR